MIRPSSLPMLAQSPCFESGDGNEFEESGTNRHAYLHALYRFDIGQEGSQIKQFCANGHLLSEEEMEAVQWAYDYIKLHAPMSDHPIHFERKMTLINAD